MERIGALGAAQRRGGAAEAWVREDVILRAAPGCGCGELRAPVDADARCEGAGAAGRPTPHFLSVRRTAGKHEKSRFLVIFTTFSSDFQRWWRPRLGSFEVGYELVVDGDDGRRVLGRARLYTKIRSGRFPSVGSLVRRLARCVQDDLWRAQDHAEQQQATPK